MGSLYQWVETLINSGIAKLRHSQIQVEKMKTLTGIILSSLIFVGAAHAHHEETDNNLLTAQYEVASTNQLLKNVVSCDQAGENLSEHSIVSDGLMKADEYCSSSIKN